MLDSREQMQQRDNFTYVVPKSIPTWNFNKVKIRSIELDSLLNLDWTYQTFLQTFLIYKR
jgi:hypothetical protein